MELREYWQVIRRRWKVGVVPAFIILLLGLITYRPPKPIYRTEFQFIVGQNLLPSAQVDEESRYYHWVTSEYVVNTIADWSNGSEFAEQVQQLLPASYDLTLEDVRTTIKVEIIRSRLTYVIEHDDPDELQTIINAVIKTATEQHSLSAPQLAQGTARFRLIDDATIEIVSPGILAQLNLLFRFIVPFGILLATIFLAEYLDPIIRSNQDMQLLKIPILGEIPRQ